MFSEETTIEVLLSKARMAESVMEVHTKSKSCKLVLNELPGPLCAILDSEYWKCYSVLASLHHVPFMSRASLSAPQTDP